ncbi:MULTISPECIES: XdhC family protein [unclassified Romboutsia]|uniref:XdhC family protein n=1 Tax=unclassified Romboutsia TaxID=2626894 RepID=UPI0008229622|nr:MULTISPECIES: XdhC/CoxI family protein [unclassified Romboutsia]SCI16101.1 xanthine dehydrogenase accessory protein XdhC [uncultured Clostridium sp.]
MHEIILSKINNEVKLGNKVALAIITDVQGSSPGKQGATLAYFSNGSTIGTVGGGILEHEIINKCKVCLKSGEDANFIHSLIKSSEETPMECGGNVKGYIKVFKPKPRLIIIGGGHVGYSLYEISNTLDFYTIIVDDREEFANKERFKKADEVYSGSIKNILNNIKIDENTYIVIATRGYEKDIEALREIINKNASYIGMIGSLKKWTTLKKTLIEEGIDENLLNSVYAPVGLNISSNDVNEIAFGIMAELLLVKNNGNLEHRKYKKCK